MATREDRSVSSLQDLATDVFFKEIVYKATPSKVEAIRDWTDQQLVGRVKKAVREKCVKKLNQISINQTALPEHQKDVQDFFSPLDCILDDNFVQLRLLIPLPLSHFFSTLMSMISLRCPSLKELDILTKFDRVIAEKPAITPNGPHLLNQLALLTLNHYDSDGSQLLVNELNQSALSIIGKSCPALISLKTNRFCITSKDVFGLIVGELADTLFSANNKPWRKKDKLIAGLQVPTELLNPVCFSLQEMQLKNSCRSSDCRLCHYSFTRFAAAFCLRHLQLLRVAELPISIADIISFLHEVRGIQSPHQAEFEHFCKEVAADFEIQLPPSAFSGLLSLQKAEVSLKDADSLQAIGTMCPNLDHVCFVDEFSSTLLSPSSSSDGFISFSGFLFAESVPPHRLKSILSGWPKLSSITLLGVDHQFLKPTLDIFGPTLKKLELDFMINTQLSDLAPCSQLEELTIKRCRNLTASYPTNWSWSSFLPFLKSIKSECCLGDWAPSFERKLDSLIDAQLNCCHIGTDGHNPRLEWSQLPELWPLLESLEVRQCSGLRIDMVSTLIPQLEGLRNVKLPRKLFQQDLARATDIQDYFASKNKPVQIEEYYSASVLFPCPFQLPV